jgi:natural product biosynthesis luciferase-like monooxygenase protein
VLPLHDPIRVAEEWALVDQLSRGRVGVAFASGWQPNDFVLAPENYVRRKELMFEQIERVRALWRGERVSATNPKGDDVALRTYPRPVQAELPIWITAAGSSDTFRRAGSIGANVLTHMLGQSVRDLAERIGAYRAARTAAGLDPASGRVTVMVHTFLGESTDAVRELVRQPMKDYLRSSASLVGGYADAWTAYKRGAGAQVGAAAMSELSPEELDELYEFAFERYFESAGLFGSVEKAAELVEALRGAGVDEIACLIDFGVAAETVIEHLPWIDQLRSSVNRVEQESHDDVVRDIEAHEITHLQCTPSLARMIPLLARDSKPLATLRQMLIGGEALPLDLVGDLYALLPEQACILNMYGPTETTIWSTVDAVPRGTERVTIGRPIANTQCYVVDSRRELVPPGQVGELLIGGDGVALGYHERPDLTAERFFDLTVGGARRRTYATGDLVRHLPDGRLEYVGRSDFQVKVRGHRIELGEIESALRAEDGVRDAVVVARSDSIGAEQLVGYLVPSDGAAQRIEIESLKSALRGRLPDYMIPSTFVWLEALPLTPNGKIDRKALPEPVSASTRDDRDVYAPRTDVEAAIREVWQRVLRVPNVGVKSNFFDLGGHSILAVKVQSELSKLFGRRLPIAELFRAPTIEMLAKHFSASEAGQPAQATARGVDRARQRRAALTRRLRNSDRGEP